MSLILLADVEKQTSEANRLMGHSTMQLTERTHNYVRPAAHEAAAKLAADYWRSNTRPASM
jgi:hypothetical protein